MEVFLMEPFEAFRGILGKLVYSAFNEGHICFSREYVIPTPTDNNEKVGDIATNLGIVYDSFDSGWVDDLKTYTRRYSRDCQTKYQRHPGFYALYGKMWWAVNKDDPTIDLKTVTFADIALIGISIQTVKEAIDYGYLPKVSKFDDLTHTYNGA